jgi:hypothetical protein
VTIANQETTARTALQGMSKPDHLVTGRPRRGCAAGFSRHDSGVQWCGKQNGPQRLSVTGGPMHHWRTLGPDIPRSVASPQSRTPFLRTPVVYHALRRFETTNTAEVRCAEDTPTQNPPGGPLTQRALSGTGLWEPRAKNRPGPPGPLCLSFAPFYAPPLV